LELKIEDLLPQDSNISIEMISVSSFSKPLSVCQKQSPCFLSFCTETKRLTHGFGKMIGSSYPRNTYSSKKSLQCVMAHGQQESRTVGVEAQLHTYCRNQQEIHLGRYVNKKYSFALKAMGLCGMMLVLMACVDPPGAYAAVAESGEAKQQGFLAVQKIISFILHLDVHLGEIIQSYGTLTYGILFGIVFAETGLVVTPLLPGDSLLFATGALAALGKLNIGALLALYFIAATLGDAVNYSIGKYIGRRAVESGIVNGRYIQKTEELYNKYGGKTIVLARFVPIVRTFAPFVAGIGSMAYHTFALYNVLGALLWTGLCVGAGYLFGNIPIVHQNFSLVVLGIIVVSVLPVVYEYISMTRTRSTTGGRVGLASRGRDPRGGSMSVSFT